MPLKITYLLLYLMLIVETIADTDFSPIPVTESQAIASVLAEVQADIGPIDPKLLDNDKIIFRRDINLDGLADLFVSYWQSNHSAMFAVFIGLKDGKYRRVGTMMLTAGAAKRIVKIIPVSAPKIVDLIVFEGSGSVDSGSLARYRLAAEKLTLVFEADYDPHDKNSFQTYEAALRAVEQFASTK